MILGYFYQIFWDLGLKNLEIFSDFLGMFRIICDFFRFLGILTDFLRFQGICMGFGIFYVSRSVLKNSVKCYWPTKQAYAFLIALFIYLTWGVDASEANRVEKPLNRKLCNNKFTWCFHKAKLVLNWPCKRTRNLLN